jgi:hypothetical protein
VSGEVKKQAPRMEAYTARRRSLLMACGSGWQVVDRNESGGSIHIDGPHIDITVTEFGFLLLKSSG